MDNADNHKRKSQDRLNLFCDFVKCNEDLESVEFIYTKKQDRRDQGYTIGGDKINKTKGSVQNVFDDSRMFGLVHFFAKLKTTHGKNMQKDPCRRLRSLSSQCSNSRTIRSSWSDIMATRTDKAL